MALKYEEQQTIHRLFTKLKIYQRKNRSKVEYYEAKTSLKEISKITQIDFSTSAKMAVGLAGTIVDIINSRLKYRGIDLPETTEGQKVKEILEQNNVLETAPQIHIESLITGVNFLVVGRGDVEQGEPSTLITIEDPSHLTFEINPRTRKISAALKVIYNYLGEPDYATLMTPSETIELIAVNEGTDDEPEWGFKEENREEHFKGFVPVIPFSFKKRANDISGRSLITPVVMSCVDSIQRNNFVLEINRDFHAMPQKIFIGAEEKSFKNRAWKAYADAMLAIGYTKKESETGEVEWIKPDIKQFSSNSPAPIIELNREATRQLSVESMIPQTYFGIQYANPSSEGATRIGEASMIALCESIAGSFSSSYKKLVEMIAAFELDEIPAWVAGVDPEWGDPAILTKEGERTYALSLAEKGIIQKDSDYLFDVLDIPESTRNKIREENAAAAENSLLATLQRIEAGTGEEATTLSQAIIE